MNLLHSFLQDLRFGGRTLRRNPAFAAIAVLTLALGIGATSAIFSVVNAVLLEPLPWRDPEKAVMIWSRWVSFDKTWVASGEVVEYRKRSRTLTDIGAWGEAQVNLTADGEPERVAAALVTSNLFSVLGVRPLIGRTFTAEEDLPNGPDLVVLGFGLWNRRYGGDSSLVGRTILISGRPHQVIGVMPPGFVLPTDFRNPERSQLWTMLKMDPASTDYGSHGFYAAGRLAAGATVEQASAELRGITGAMTGEGLYPPQMQFNAFAVSLTDEVVGSVRREIWLLFGAVAFLLLIACANVASLLLARAEARQREIAVRSALGAGGLRVARQLLTEGVALAVISGAAGLAVAWAGVRVLAWWNPASIPRVAGVALDTRVLIFTAAVALLASVLFSLAPALRALGADLTDALKEGGHGASAGAARRRFRSVLVVVEMALAVALLVGAGLTLRSLWALQRVPLGFDPGGVLTLRLSPPAASYESPEEVVAFYGRLLERVRALPGVREAGAARVLPLGSTIGDFGLTVEGYQPPPGTNAKGDWQIATPGYLEALGERIVSGRSITADDRTGGQLVGLINEEMVRRYWQDRDPIGGRFKIGGSSQRPWVTVVGVVADVRHNGITEVIKEKFYIPHAQWHESTGFPIRAMTLAVKADGHPATLAGPIRQIVRALDPNLPLAEVRTMDDVVDAALSTPAFTGLLLASFAGLALVLAAIGIYGVLSYAVSRRTREIGIRVAIGAGRAEVMRLIFSSGLGLSLAGLAIGLALAAWIARLIAGLLHDVSPMDPLTYTSVAAILLAVGLTATLVPAWRATRVDPVTALRSE